MELISVNVGTARPIVAKAAGKSGIFKDPAAGPVRIGTLGLENDAIIDTANHGGEDQAVYLYTEPDYAWWSEQVGRALGPGTFGDNLTISGLESAMLAIGDRLQMGGVIIAVTSPRIPCATLAARMEDPEFIKKFRAGERPGAYCRVIETGSVQAGDEVRLTPYQGERVTILEFFRWYYEDMTEDQLARLLAAPLSGKVRKHYEKKAAGKAAAAGG